MHERLRGSTEVVCRTLPTTPATPPAHVLIAAQQSAGNQAVARGLIQRVTASPASEGEHGKAQEAHDADRVTLLHALKAGAHSGDERLRNSAMWILEGKSCVYALTPTADSEARAKTAKETGKRALFGYPTKDKFTTGHVGGHVLDTTVATYNHADMESNDEVTFDSPDSAGFRSPSGGKICVVEPSRIDAINALRKQLHQPGTFPPIAETLKHETQHEADWDFGHEAIDARSDSDRALLEYRTEFRAYTAQEAAWLQDPPPTGEAERFGFSDAVQFQIFHHIYKGYPRVKAAWDGDVELSKDRKFRVEVLKMRGGIESISANPYNSPRVDDFLHRVRDVNRKDPLDERLTGDLITLLQRFDDHDRETIRNSRFYPFEDLKDWVKQLVDTLLEDPKANVEPILAAERQRRAQEAAQRRAEMLKRPPKRKPLLEAFRNWTEVRECLKTLKTKDDVTASDDTTVNEELDVFADDETNFAGNFEDFVGNLHPDPIDWWSVLETYGVTV